MGTLKVNMGALDLTARQEIAGLLDEYAAELALLSTEDNLSASVNMLTAKVQAKILAVELRGGGENEVAKLRETVDRLKREVEVLTIERDGLKKRVKG